MDLCSLESAHEEEQFHFGSNCFIDQNIFNDIFDFIYGFRGASHKRTNVARDTRPFDDYFRSLMRQYGSFRKRVALLRAAVSRTNQTSEADRALGHPGVVAILEGLNLLAVRTQADNLFRFDNLFAVRQRRQ